MKAKRNCSLKICLLILLFAISNQFICGIDTTMVNFCFAEEEYTTEPPGKSMDLSNVPQNIDGTPLSKTRQIPYNPKSLKFRVVHKIPAQQYQEEFTSIYKNGKITGALKVGDIRKGQKRTFNNSVSLGSYTVPGEKS